MTAAGSPRAARRLVVWACALGLISTGAGVARAAGPTLTLSATAATAGSSLDVSGSGFPGAAELALELDGAMVAQESADASGAVSASLTIPATASAGRHVVALVDAADGLSAQETVVVEPPGAPIVRDESVTTPSVGVLRFAISLPAGYETSGRRYPVIYFLHGLPADESAYRAWPGQLDAALGAAARNVIVVAPQAARAGDPDPEYLDWGSGRDWATALTTDLPAYVDAHYPTIASRADRAIVGLSAGGYGAIILGLRHPAEFSVVESWSGYFTPTTPSGKTTLNLGSAGANAQASAYALVPRLRALLRTQPLLIAFYVGSGDGLFRTPNVRFHQRLLASRIPHTFAVYPGGHRTSLWVAHAGSWLRLALAHLAPAR